MSAQIARSVGLAHRAPHPLADTALTHDTPKIVDSLVPAAQVSAESSRRIDKEYA